MKTINKQLFNNNYLFTISIFYIMKKFFIFAAIAGAALVGCTKNEPVRIATPDSPIGFTAIASPNTKAAIAGEMPANYNTGEKFIAFAAWTESDYSTASAATDFFVNDLTSAICTYNATVGAWKPADTYYWPKTGKLTFEAVSPADAKSDGTITQSWADGIIITNFTVKAAIADQYDLMYSNREFNKVRSDYTANSTGSPYDDEDDSGSNPIYNGVNLLFNHALSSIVFYVKTAADYSSSATIKLKTLTINKADSQGTFDENITDGAASSWAAAPAWDKTYTAATEVDYSIFNGDLTLSSTAQKLGDSSVAASALVGSANNIILLPQDLAHGTGCNDVTVTLTYTISQNGSAAVNQTSVVTLKTLKDTGNTTIDEWEIGKRYTYTIAIGLEEIYFDPKVSNWTDVTMAEETIGY